MGKSRSWNSNVRKNKRSRVGSLLSSARRIGCVTSTKQRVRRDSTPCVVR